MAAVDDVAATVVAAGGPGEGSVSHGRPPCRRRQEAPDATCQREQDAHANPRRLHRRRQRRPDRWRPAGHRRRPSGSDGVRTRTSRYSGARPVASLTPKPMTRDPLRQDSRPTLQRWAALAVFEATKDAGPFVKGQIAGHQHAAALVARGYTGHQTEQSHPRHIERVRVMAAHHPLAGQLGGRGAAQAARGRAASGDRGARRRAAAAAGPPCASRPARSRSPRRPAARRSPRAACGRWPAWSPLYGARHPPLRRPAMRPDPSPQPRCRRCGTPSGPRRTGSWSRSGPTCCSGSSRPPGAGARAREAVP